MDEGRECSRCSDVILYCKCPAEYAFAKRVITEAGLDPSGYDDWLWHRPTMRELAHSRATGHSARADWYQRSGAKESRAFWAEVNRLRNERGLKPVPDSGPTFWEEYAEDAQP